ncbi:platelet-activating factor acetylhydrolase [Xylariaceae sp. FL1272]|nr:platelet-activating factor acetylhydrolase [Xylariaceae sp. FL1272]
MFEDYTDHDISPRLCSLSGDIKLRQNFTSIDCQHSYCSFSSSSERVSNDNRAFERNMRQHTSSSLLVAWATGILLFTSTGLTIEIPQPTGWYYIGTRKFEIPFLNTEDIFAPGNTSTCFIATLYYPTLQKPCGPGKPYLDPVDAVLWETYTNYTAGTLAGLTSHLQHNAPFAPAPEGSAAFPTLLFGPGGTGPPTETYTILISELVSRGYVVAGLDHPYEQPFVRYPNGTALYGVPLDYQITAAAASAVYEFRVKDNVHFIEIWPDLVSDLGAPWTTTNLGAFGHSLGGAAAAGTALLIGPEILASTLNIDGALWNATNDTATADTKRPALLLGGSYHTPEESGDVSWTIFPEAQTSWWRTLLVQDALHLDFSDFTFWKTLGDLPLGEIDGLRAIEVTREFVTAFFNYTLLGQQEEILSDPGSSWPEVFVYDSSDDV